MVKSPSWREGGSLITVRSVPLGTPLDPAWQVVALDLAWAPPTPGVDGVVERLQATLPLTSEGLPAISSDIDARQQRWDWGAAGTCWDICMTVAGGILGTAIWEGMKALFSELKAGLEEGSAASLRPIGRDEAEARARWFIEASYDSAGSGLSIVGERELLAEHEWEFDYEDGRFRYRVRVAADSDLATILELQRTELSLGRRALKNLTRSRQAEATE